MNKVDWIARFVTELVVRAQPQVPAKFARTVAMQRWVTHADQAPDEVARVWFEARRSQIGAHRETPID